MNSLVPEESVTHTRPFIRRVVVAVDLTDHSITTAEYAVKIARAFGASLVFVYVHPIETMFNFITGGGYDLIDEEQQHRRHALINLAEAGSKEYPFCTSTFLVGDPAEEVPKFAQEMEADLVVVASRHPDVLASFLHLDQASKMVHRAMCPVLVYRGD